MVGGEPIGDPYDIENLFEEIYSAKMWRKMVKLALLISMNAKTMRAAENGVAKEFIKVFPDYFREEDRSEITRFVGGMIQALKQKHSLIADYFCSDAGVYFQFLDSEMMARVQRECRALGILVLVFMIQYFTLKARRRWLRPFSNRSWRIC